MPRSRPLPIGDQQWRESAEVNRATFARNMLPFTRAGQTVFHAGPRKTRLVLHENVGPPARVQNPHLAAP
jgi:hypothetical protein